VNKLVAALSRHAFVRFAIIGGLGYFVAAGILAFCSDVLKLDFAAANAFSIFLSMCFTWLGNRYFTFRQRRARGFSGMAQEWLKFTGANAVGAVVNYATALLLVRYAPAPFHNKFVAQACGVLAGLAFNFTLSSRMVFRRPAP
jgi:dolichol-phosphate mannosyltransferase